MKSTISTIILLIIFGFISTTSAQNLDSLNYNFMGIRWGTSQRVATKILKSNGVKIISENDIFDMLITEFGKDTTGSFRFKDGLSTGSYSRKNLTDPEAEAIYNSIVDSIVKYYGKPSEDRNDKTTWSFSNHLYISVSIDKEIGKNKNKRDFQVELFVIGPHED